MKLKQVNLIYDPNKDTAALVHFLSGKPVEARDVNQQFIHAILQWIEESETGESHFTRVWWRRFKSFLGFKRKHTRVVDSQRGMSYTITMTQTPIKEKKECLEPQN